MLHDGRIVVEQQVLPVGTEALDGLTIGIQQIVGVAIERSHAVLYVALVLQDGIVGSSCYVALLPRTLPAIREVIVDRGLTHLTLLRGNEDNTVGGTSTIDSTRGSILQHLDTLNIARVHALHTILVSRHAIDNIEGFRVVDRTDTTNANHRLCARLTRR